MSTKKAKQNEPVKPQNSKTGDHLKTAATIIQIIAGLLAIVQKLLEIFSQ